MTETTIELKASQFAGLVRPAMPFAHQDGMMPTLNAVKVEARGDYLTATATDRFRIVINRIKLDSAPPADLDVLIGLTELRSMLSIFKRTRDNDPLLRITFGDSTLKVEQSGGFDFLDASMTFSLRSGDYPRVSHLIVKENLTEPVNMVGLNATYLADFKAAVRGSILIAHSANVNKPMIVTAGADFIGAIMPVRISDAESSFDSWIEFLAEKPAAKGSKKAAA